MYFLPVLIPLFALLLLYSLWHSADSDSDEVMPMKMGAVSGSRFKDQDKEFVTVPVAPPLGFTPGLAGPSLGTATGFGSLPGQPPLLKPASATAPCPGVMSASGAISKTTVPLRHPPSPVVSIGFSFVFVFVFSLGLIPILALQSE